VGTVRAEQSYPLTESAIVGNRTNRDPGTEEQNQQLVEERKKEIETGKVPPGIERGSSPRDHDKKE
jgi:hypothetical protein